MRVVLLLAYVTQAQRRAYPPHCARCRRGLHHPPGWGQRSRSGRRQHKRGSGQTGRPRPRAGWHPRA